MSKSKEHIVEGKTKAFKARISYYPDGRILVALCKLGPLFWDCFKHDMYKQEHLAEAQFKEHCEEAEMLAEADI